MTSSGTWPEDTKTAAFLENLTLAVIVLYAFSTMRVLKKKKKKASLSFLLAFLRPYSARLKTMATDRPGGVS